MNADGREFVLADIPGLIEGAHEGAGLGDRFLGHIERCRVLLHLVDATCEHAGKAYKTVRHELEAYGGQLAEKVEIVALNKIDAVGPEDLKKQRDRLKRAAKKTPLLLSGATGAGVKEALRALAEVIGEAPVTGKAYKTVRAELEAYGGSLAEKTEIVALNKIDAVDADALKKQKDRLKRAAKKTPLLLSGATGAGVQEVLRALADIIGDKQVTSKAKRAAETEPWTA